MNPLSIIILAAGKGKRMNNPSMAKVMALLAGKPLIQHVLEQVIKLNYSKINVVVGHQKESVIEFVKTMNIPNLEFVEQNEQLGTGHAVAQCEYSLKNTEGNIMILAGDVPLMKYQTLEYFYKKHIKNKAYLSDLTVKAPNPKGYGRIIRDSKGEFLKIVEEKDGLPEELIVNEINSGIFIVKSGLLFDALRKISNKNAQGEYYLTDIVHIFYSEGYKINACLVDAFNELQGINSVEELKKAEEFYFLKYIKN